MKKRSDGRYQLSVMIGYNADGSPKRKLVYGKTQKEAKEKASELLMQNNMGVLVESNILVGEWAKTWITAYKSGVSYNTRRSYQGIIDAHIVPNIGLFKLKDIKTAHLQNIVNSISDRPRVANLFKLTVSQMFKQAISNDIVFKNPAEGIKLPVSVVKQRKRALSEDESKLLFSVRLDKRTKFLVLFLYFTGMRKNEALAITKSDIDLVSNSISVNKTLIVIKNKTIVQPNPKTATGVRSIPILDQFKPFLVDYLKSVKSEFLFITSKGETFSLSAYRRLWAKFEKAIGTKEITAHILRHNFATILYNAGVDVKSAQSILGHKNISVTLGVYTHLDNNKRDEATTKLNNFFSGV